MNAEKNTVISATELKLNLGKYLDLTVEKQEFVITKNNQKIARLTPYITRVEDYFLVKENAQDYAYGGKKVSYGEFIEICANSSLRMEFINGEIHLLSSPSSFHQEQIGKLYILFDHYFKDKRCKVYMAPFDVHFYKQGFEEPDVMQPDLTVACDHENTIDENGRYMGTPSLVVEILSPNSRKKDMLDKLNTYMLSGVGEYWIADPKKQSIYVYLFTDRSIETMKSYSIQDIAQSFIFEGLACSVHDLFS